MPACAHLYPTGNAVQLRRFVAVLGGVCALLGCLVLVGWLLHLPLLLQVRPSLPPMQYNTALCFILAGSALLAWAWGRAPQAIPVLGGLVALGAGLTLAEYLFQTDLGIDQWLFHSYITTATSHVGRMAPASALCLTLTGLALLCLGLGFAPRWRPAAVGSLASINLSISAVAILGYAFGLPGTYGWGQLTRIAMHTAIGLGLLGTALFLIAWSIGRRPLERTPRWLPLPLTISVFAGSLVLYFALEGRQDEEIIQTVKAGAESAKGQINVRMEARMHALVRMARQWEFAGAPARAAWESEAANHIHDLPDLQAAEWIDASHCLRWIVPAAGNEARLNLPLIQEERRHAAAERAERERQPVITRILPLFRGKRGFAIYAPIVLDGRPSGFLAETFDAQLSLDRFLPPAVAAGEAIRLSEDGQVFYERDAGAFPDRHDWVVEEKIELHGAVWTLRIWPTPALAARLNSPLPLVVLSAGALASLLLAAVCLYAQRASRHATETARANAALRSALEEVKTLEGLLPICCSCKRVRDDTGYWNQIDTYLHKHTNASLSHGFCPECAAKTCQDFGLAVPAEIQAELAAGNFE